VESQRGRTHSAGRTGASRWYAEPMNDAMRAAQAKLPKILEAEPASPLAVAVPRLGSTKAYRSL